ncbi:MAG: iron ABC transporter permease [Planctomycetota bacterium]
MTIRTTAPSVIAAALLLAGLIVSVVLGTTAVPLGVAVEALMGRGEPQTIAVVQQIRLPRAVCAALVGANLALAGVMLQGVMRNPLAAPNIVGVTAGAGLGATLTLVLAPIALSPILPAAAFIGALAAALVVYTLALQPGSGTAPVRLVLAGVAVSAMLTAVTTFVMLLRPERVPSVVMWLAGNLNTVGWRETGMALPFTGEGFSAEPFRGVAWYTVVAIPVMLWLSRPLDLLQLGEERARSLGVATERVRFVAITVAAWLAGAAVSVAGLVGFIGLIVPHAMRMVTGPRHAALLPAAALGGAALLVWADLAARVFPVGPMPVGIFTALLGGPYFIALLHSARLVR